MDLIGKATTQEYAVFGSCRIIARPRLRGAHMKFTEPDWRVLCVEGHGADCSATMGALDSFAERNSEHRHRQPRLVASEQQVWYPSLQQVAVKTLSPPL